MNVKVRVNHNGCLVYQSIVKTSDDCGRVDDFIQSKLRKDLNPKKVFEYQSRGIYVEVYEYDNLQQEVFVTTMSK